MKIGILMQTDKGQPLLWQNHPEIYTRTKKRVYQMKKILIENGWTIKTAICMLIFSLCHFPCSTTCLTIKKETGSFKWMILAIFLPTIIGIALCFLVNQIFNFL